MTAMSLTSSVSDMRGSANDLNNFLFQEIPYPYAQVSFYMGAGLVRLVCEPNPQCQR